VVSTIDVRCVTLDQAASRYGFEDAAFLKLDTQGTELDILRSGGQLMASLLGIHLEVSFQPFYSGQAIFHDVDAYLVQQGFTLRALNRTMLRRAGYRATIYSKRDVTWAHCLYLREPAAIGGNPRVPQRPLSRLLGLTVAFQYFDLAMEIAAALGRDWLNAADAQQLLVEIEQASEISHRHLAWKRERSDADPKRAAAELLAASVRDKSLID
jgi:hypothetical protein